MAALHLAIASRGLSQIAQTGDGVFLGLALAYVAVRSIIKFTTTSAALGKIRDAPFVQVADLRSIAALYDGSDREQILVLRGTVESRFVAESNPIFCSLLRITIPNPLIPHFIAVQLSKIIPHSIIAELSEERAVIYHRTKRFVYNGWISQLQSLFTENKFIYACEVPFVLTPRSLIKRDYVTVNMEGSHHPLPLVPVFHGLHPNSSAYNLLHTLFGQENPVGILEQEKILRLWSDITAVGYVSLKDGIAEIKSCKDLPYFLSRMSKNEMLEDLSSRVIVLLFSGVIFGSFAIGILGYAAVRNWDRWKKWRQHRRESGEH